MRDARRFAAADEFRYGLELCLHRLRQAKRVQSGLHLRDVVTQDDDVMPDGIGPLMGCAGVTAVAGVTERRDDLARLGPHEPRAASETDQSMHTKLKSVILPCRASANCTRTRLPGASFFVAAA